MSKKLVKTAKQQFEERLRELNVISEWKRSDAEIYYRCEDKDGNFCLLYVVDDSYYEDIFGVKYEDLIKSEIFLATIVNMFIDARLEVKPLFGWYASSCSGAEPFNLSDIATSELPKEECIFFEDIYECSAKEGGCFREEFEQLSMKMADYIGSMYKEGKRVNVHKVKNYTVLQDNKGRIMGWDNILSFTLLEGVIEGGGWYYYANGRASRFEGYLCELSPISLQMLIESME